VPSRVRVVSLVPSITETLLEWGTRPVGVTRFCPGSGSAKVGGTKNPDIAAIVALAPDLVVMDKQENRVEDADTLVDVGVRVHVTDVRSVSDVEPTLRALAEAVGRPAPDPGGFAPPVRQPDRPVSAWVPIWRRPWMSIGGGTYGSSVLEAAGITNVLAGEPEPYPTAGPAEVASLRPDVVLAPSEPYPFKERHRSELEAVAPVVFVDGQDLFWWGTRTPGALDRLRAMAAGLAGR